MFFFLNGQKLAKLEANIQSLVGNLGGWGGGAFSPKLNETMYPEGKEKHSKANSSKSRTQESFHFHLT